MISEGAEAEKMAPSVKGNKVSSDREERRGEIEKEKKQKSFDCLMDGWAGKEIESEGDEECWHKGKSRRGRSSVGRHQQNDRPCFGQVKGKRGQHNDGASPDSKEKPPKAWGQFERGVGRAPVPSGEKQEKESGGEGIGAPNEQISGRDGEVDKEKGKQK